MTFWYWLLYLWAAWTQPGQGVIVRGPLALEPVPALARLSPQQLRGAQAVWVWSPLREPRRLTPESLKRPAVPFFGPGRTILVRVPAARGRRAAGLRLIAAPVEMWREVPEPLLPAWPLPRTGRLTIPADAARSWRLRVVGEGRGSFWTDLPPGAQGAVLSVVATPGARSALETSGGKPAAGGAVRIFEGAVGRLGGTRDWALVIAGDDGRFSLPGLPDRSELTWLASAREHPPVRIVSTASRLPSRIVLADGAAVRGRLVDSGGRPLAGATVRVDAWASAEAPISFAVKVETGPDGRFNASAVPLGKAMLSLRKAGWAPLRRPVAVPREGIDVGTLALSRGSSLTVQAVDDAGTPIAGAEIRPDLGEPATTGSDGIARLMHLPEQGEVSLRAVAQGHLSSEPQAVRLPAADPVELRLPRAFRVLGRFVAADGEPLAGATVRITRGRHFDTAPLDPDGSFALSLPPASSHALTFTSPRSASLDVAVAEGSPGEERDLGVLRAPAGGEIAGRLVDGGTGEPVPGARIWCPRPSRQGPLVAWMSRDLLEASSGPDGSFRLQGLPPGEAVLRVEASGFARSRRAVEVPGEGTADLGDLPLSRGTALSVVTGPRGEGADARVDPGGQGLPFDRLTAPVRNGAALVEQVPPGPAKVSVVKGSAVLCEKSIQVQDGDAAASVDCPAEGILVHGAVTLGGRAAGAGLLIWDTAAEPMPEGILRIKTPAGLTRNQVFTANAPSLEVTVEPGGTFATRDLHAGAWQVAFQPDGGGATEARSLTLSEEKDQAVLLPFPGFSVTGTVRDPDGRPVEQARVRETEGGTTVLSGADGSFRFEGLRAKAYFFAATKEEAASDPLEVAVGEDQPGEPIVLTLREENRRPAFEAHVTDERGAPAGGAFVFVELPGRGLRVLTADVSGTASLLLDPPYPDTVRAAARAGDAWVLGAWQPFDKEHTELTLASGGTGSLALQAGRSAGLLQIDGPGGWSLTTLLGLLGSPPLVQPGGALRLDGLPAGVYRLHAGDGVQSVAVREGAETTIALP